MGKLDGKVAFITGAARGQGRSHAIKLAQEGADIIAVDICEQIGTVGFPLASEEDLAQTVKEVEALDRRIVATKADVRDSGRELNQDVGDTVKQVNGQVLPETTRTLQQAQKTFGAVQGMLADDAPLQQDLGRTLQEVQRGARSLRTLTELLGRHPQSLLRGIPEDMPPAAVPFHQPNNAQEPRR